MDAFNCYTKYLAFKLHFTSKNYDYFKFNGKINADKATFEKRNDKYFFSRISKKFSSEEYENYLVANFVENDNVWIGDLLEEKGKSSFLSWTKRVDSLKYSFKEDINKIISNEPIWSQESFNKLFKSKKGQYPILLEKTLHKEIGIESFIVLNILLDFLPDFDNNIKDRLIWPEFKNKCLKYQPFLVKKINKKEFKQILKSCLDIR